MKKTALVFISIMLIFFIVACTPQANIPKDNTDKTKISDISEDERQRIDLYVSVMKAAYNEENGGSEFIALKLDTLDGLSNKAKQEVLNELTSLSSDVCDFEDAITDNTKFELDSNDNFARSINGTLLYIQLEQYSENKATITGVSWFGNMGAVFPSYEATYKNGVWNLKLISMAIS